MKNKLILIVIILFAMSCEKEAPLPGEGFITPTATTEWKEGELQDIKWEPQGREKVMISLCRHTGGNGIIIIWETEDDGIYEKMKIEDQLEPLVQSYDEFDVFYIEICSPKRCMRSENFIIYGE